MKSMTRFSTQTFLIDIKEKLVALMCVALFIELVFFKFIPDIGTATYQHRVSVLCDKRAYQDAFLIKNTVMYPRFLGNQILWNLSAILDRFVHSTDMRMQTLRIGAGILTPAYFLIGALPGMSSPLINWHRFIVFYSLLFLAGLYVFYPYDAPSLAFISLGLACLMLEQRGWALMFMLVAGLFRESAFHVAAMVGVWALVDKSASYVRRMAWAFAFFIAFALEYKAIRYIYPGPIAAGGGLILSARELLFGKGLYSLTTIVSLGLAAMFSLAYLVVRQPARGDWRDRFMLINCALLPGWVIFYRMMNGNISEFRMLWPAVLPLVYGVALIAEDNRPIPDHQPNIR